MIKKFTPESELVWDNFLKESVNGNFQESRAFLNYHRDRYIDHSLMFYKNNVLAAILPCNVADNGKSLISHSGATFGGLIFSQKHASITSYKWILNELNQYIKDNGFKHFEMKMPSWLYMRSDEHIEVFDYMLGLDGFSCGEEVGFFLDCSNLGANYEQNYAKLKKRKLKKALKENLAFRELNTDDEIAEFYSILEENYTKFNTSPVHTYDELILLKEKCIPGILSFYGVFFENQMIAGSMVFDFNNKKVFHTQYLASRFEYLEMCPNEFLYTKLIATARDKGFRFLSFGTSTLEHGSVFNEELALFKEGFNTETYINRTYKKDY